MSWKNWGTGRGGSRTVSTDAEIYSVVDRNEVIEFAYPRGTVLFIESSGCFHFGSRNSIKPRFQLMYAYTGVCRTDLSELITKPKVYPIREIDSRLRKMVLSTTLPEHIELPGTTFAGYRLRTWPLPRPGVSRPARMSGDLR